MLSPAAPAVTRVAVKALEADDDERAGPRLRRAPGPVIIMADAGADRLHQQPHRLPLDRDEALDPQHVFALGKDRDARRERRRVLHLADGDDEAVEIVVVVVELVVVMGAPVLDVVLGADAEPEHRGRIDLAVRDRDDLHRARQRVRHRGKRALRALLVQKIALVENDEIGASDLVLEHFFDGIVVVERGVRLALCGERIEIGGDPSAGERRPVDHRDHAIHGDAALDRRPVERLHQRLRQREPRRLDDDVLDGRRPREDRVERRHELVRDRAAETAIGELDDVLFRAGRVAAALQDFAVDADIAELIDDDGEPAPVRLAEDVPDQRCLARAEKARDDGAGNAGDRRRHSVSSSKSSGGTREIRPRFRMSGRPRQGIRPSFARASSRAPSIKLCASRAVSSSPNT